MALESLRYEESGESLGLREFFHVYRDALPQLLIVKEGFYSCSDMETLSRDQIIFVSSYATQVRVLAVETGEQGRIFSLPQCYPVPFTLAKKRLANDKESPCSSQSLEAIVNQHKLPVEVNMMTNSVPVSVADPDGESVSSFSTMRLMEVFSEVFLVGNLVEAGMDDGRLYTQPIPVPLYLTQVTVTRLVGPQTMPHLEWVCLLDSMAKRVQSLRRKVRLTSSDLIIYAKNMQCLQKFPGKLMTKAENIYDFLTPVTVVNLQAPRPTAHAHTESMRRAATVQNRYSSPKSGRVREWISSQIDSNQRDSTYETLKATPPTPPKPEVKPKPNQGQRPDKPTPPQPNATVRLEPATDYLTPQHSPYETDRLRKSSVLPDRSPSFRSGRRPPPPPPPRTRRVTSLSSDLTSVSRESHVDLRPPVPPVTSLTISEVCETLLLLNLERHQEVFRQQMVDGAVLSRMQIEDLRSDFSMTSAEAIRLMLYVTEGHVPK